MIVTDLIWTGFLLPAIGVAGMAVSRATSSAERKPEAIRVNSKPGMAEETSVSSEVEALRAINQARLVSVEEEGLGVGSLPNGVYGFTYAPHQEVPLFRKKMFRNFEVHKLSDGGINLIGYVTEREASLLSDTVNTVEVSLYPDPYEEAGSLVSVPFDRVERFKGPSRDRGNALNVRLAPNTEPVQ